MSRKHYNVIAAIIASRVKGISMDSHYMTMLEQMAKEIAEVLQDEYPDFNLSRFMLACGFDA